MKPLYIVVLALVSCTPAKRPDNLYIATDFTADSLFTNNIEGPAFDKNGHLYLVNYGSDGTIGRVNESGQVELFLTLNDSSIANSIKFDSEGFMYLADWRGHNVLRVDMNTRQIETYVHSDQFNQPNDLCINKRDQLFASDPNWKEATGKLWRIDKGGELVLLADSMGTTNGIELNPDETILYVNESVQRKVWAFDVDDRGNISNKRLFASVDDFGFDGMKCDSEGNLYLTRYGKGTILILSPAGEVMREIQLKGKNCSNLVFGGPQRSTVFVTLQDRGSIEKFEAGVPGR
jgi:sugar lactone lactonase YvrE